MADIQAHVDAELANITKAIASLPSPETMISLSELEIAGVAALLHSFYSGIENVLKQLLMYRDVELPSGRSWHRELLEAAENSGILSDKVVREMREYLAFRHFFSHAYALDLDPNRLSPLVDRIANVYGRFKADVESCLSIN